MPGDASLPLPRNPIHCPVHRVSITPCERAELDPLLIHLNANLAVHELQQFPRGTLMPDGRLDLCKQSLGTVNCLHIVDALRHNTQVRSLMLGTDAIGDAGAAAVAQLAVDNSSLEILYLGCNNIGQAGAAALAGTLAQAAPNISGLWLKRNPLGTDGALSIAAMLRSNQQLRVLDLVNTDIGATGVHAIVDVLCKANHGLQSLYLSGNGLGPDSAADLARLLRQAPQIKALYLSVNHLGDDGAIELAAALRSNRSLQSLELASNSIGPAGMQALLEAARVTALCTLNLGYAPSTRALGAQANQIDDAGASLAADLVASSTTLRKLDLTRSHLSPHGLGLLIRAASGSACLDSLLVEGRLPAGLVAHLQRNWANKTGEASNTSASDQALIKSVYR